MVAAADEAQHDYLSCITELLPQNHCTFSQAWEMAMLIYLICLTLGEIAQ